MFQSRANSSQVIHNNTIVFANNRVSFPRLMPQSNLFHSIKRFGDTIFNQSRITVDLKYSKFMLDDTMSEPVLCIRSWSVTCIGKWSFYIAFHFQLQLISKLFVIRVTQQLFFISVFLFRLLCLFIDCCLWIASDSVVSRHSLLRIHTHFSKLIVIDMKIHWY